MVPSLESLSCGLGSVKLGSLLVLAVLGGCAVTSTDTTEKATTDDALRSAATLNTIVRGKTLCRDTKADNAICGVEHWTMFANKDGSRHLHVASDNIRTGDSRHAVLWIDETDRVRDAYVHSTKAGRSVGSSYIVLNDDKAYVAVDDSQFDGGDGGVKLTVLDQPDTQNSIGTGPVSADVAQFVDYDQQQGGPQAKSVYWVGGRNNTMVGGFFGAENTFVGVEAMTLVDGNEVEASHYRMRTGTEIWVLEPYDVLLKIRLAFGATKGQVYETVELSISEQIF